VQDRPRRSNYVERDCGLRRVGFVHREWPHRRLTRAIRTPASKLRLGVPKADFYENLNPETAKALETARDVLGKITAGIREVDVPPAGNVPTSGTPKSTPITCRGSRRHPNSINSRLALSFNELVIPAPWSKRRRVETWRCSAATSARRLRTWTF